MIRRDGPRELTLDAASGNFAEPQVLAALRDRRFAWQDRVTAGAATRLADLLGMAPPRGELREQVPAHLVELCD